MVLGFGETCKITIGIVGHIVDRRLCAVMHRDAGDVAIAVHLGTAFAISSACRIFNGDVFGDGNDILIR